MIDLSDGDEIAAVAKVDVDAQEENGNETPSSTDNPVLENPETPTDENPAQ